MLCERFHQPLVESLSSSVHAALRTAVGDQTGTALENNSQFNRTGSTLPETPSHTKKAATPTPRPIERIEAMT
jgi:hypothetical protein